MTSAGTFRTVVVLALAVAVLAFAAVAGWAAAQSAPECPTDWPDQGYAGPLREEDRGQIQYEDFHSDAEGGYWYIIRGADSNGYATVRAYPAARGDDGYITDSPDRVCYLIVREPGRPADLIEPRQVLFPRESDEPARSATAREPGETPTPTATPTPTQTPTPTVPIEPEEPVPPVLALLELDGATIDTNEVIRGGLEPGQEVQITLRVSDAGGRPAYLALVAEDGAELDRVDCTDGMEQECTLTSTLFAPGTYSTTLRLRLIAVDDTGAETELATISLTTRDRPRPPPSSGSGSGSSDSGSGSSDSSRVRLEIEPPEQLGPFIADIPAVIYPVVEYTGRYRLYFNLPQGPAGMVIDPDTGVVTWTPPEDDEGRSFDVTIAVTDGSLTEETTFEITVMDPQRIRSSITSSDTDGNVLKITDSDTDLEGLTITSPADDPPITIRTLAELQKILELADDDNVPEVPDWITPLTDVFVVKGAFATPVELRLPIGELVDDLPEEAQFTDINLYAYTEITETEGLYWVPVSVGFSYEGSDMDDLTYIVSLEGMQGLAFFGYHVSEPALPFEATPQNMSHFPSDSDEGFHISENRATNIALHYGPLNTYGGTTPVAPGTRSITDGDGAAVCESWAIAGSPLCPDPVPVEEIQCQHPKWELSEAINLIRARHNDYRCTYSGDPEVDIWVIDFGPGCRWEADASAPVNAHTRCSEGRSTHDIAAWLIEAQSALDLLGLGYDKGVKVQVQPMSDLGGYVNGGYIECAGTLHVADDNGMHPQVVKGIVLHEFFHHAQFRGITSGGCYTREPLFYHGDDVGWLMEGTADWFPDEVDDTLDPLVIGNRQGARILEVGLHLPLPQVPLEDDYDAAARERFVRQNEYERSPFFKLMTEKCAEFYANVKPLLTDRGNPSGGTDSTGIHNLRRVMAEASCNFGDHLNSESILVIDRDRSANAEAALTYYNYATQLKDDLSLFDDNETYFQFDPPDFDFEPSIPRVLPAELPEGDSLIYTLTFPPFDDLQIADRAARYPWVFVPPMGAYSAHLPLVSGSLPEGTVAELIVVPHAEELFVSIVGANNQVAEEDFYALNTIGPDGDLHAWFSTDESYSYILSRTTVPPVFFTVANPHPHSIIQAAVYLRIREENGGKPARELIEGLLELNSTDRGALVELYNSTGGPTWFNDDRWLETDRNGNEHALGAWYGVQTDFSERVEAITLTNNNLEGTIPVSLGDLDRLKALDLTHNKIRGEIPAALGNLNILFVLYLSRNELTGQIPASLGELRRAYTLYLNENFLDGEIPPELGSMSDLQYLNLAENELTGEIPSELGDLPDLQWLILNDNELTGDIPTELGTLTELTILDLHSNELTGEIPAQLGNLRDLQELELGLNDLTGGVPQQLGDMENLRILDLGQNDLSGEIPETFKQLEELTFLDLGGNNFTEEASDMMTNLLTLPLERLDLSNNGLTGGVPQQLADLLFLERFYLDGNELTGSIPTVLGSSPRLQRLHLHDNMLTGEIPGELGGFAFLERLRLNGNQLDGGIPEELGNLFHLEYLYLNENMLTGAIPTELGNLYSLERLYLHENQLDGSIPASLGDLYNLERLYLYDNALTDSIPADLAKLGDQSVLDELRLENNQLSGSIPAALGDLVSLTELNLGSNSLDGAIPTALGDLANLEELLLNNNGLTDAIPTELGNLAALRDLDLSHNQLAQAIPTDLGDLSLLETLHLNNNALADSIPTELGSLANLSILHLNANQLTGTIPSELGMLTNLEELRLDSNMLESMIPTELTNLTNLKVLHLSGNTITGCIPQGLADIDDNDLVLLGLADC